MTTTIMSEPRQRYYDNDGLPLSGGLVYTYAAGTTTPKLTWSDSAGTIPNTNPISLDSKGEAVIYWSGPYKVNVTSSIASGGVQITGYPVDNYVTDQVGTLRTDLLATNGAARMKVSNGYTVQQQFDLVYMGIANVTDPQYAGGADATGVTNTSAAIRAAAASGKWVYLPPGSFQLDDCDINTLGQMVFGSGMGTTDIIAVAGGNGFTIKARNCGVREMRFIPSGNVTNEQSAVAYDCITIQADTDEHYVEALEICRVTFENLVGAAIKIISPLRESSIYECRFIGMGDVVNNIGPIDCINPSNTNRSPNNLYIRDNTFYRFGTPAINFKVLNTGSVVGRSEPFYEGIHIERNLIHGQLLSIALLPGGFSVYPEPTNSIFIESVQGLHMHWNTITAFHPQHWGIFVTSFINAALSAYNINFNVFVSENTVAYHELSTPSYTGGCIRIKDSLNTDCSHNSMLTGGGGFAQCIKIDNGGAHSSVLVSNIIGNLSIDQFPLTYRIDNISTLVAGSNITLTGASPRVTSYNLATGHYGYVQQDGSGVLTIACNEGAIAGACYTQFKVRGASSVRVGEYNDLSLVSYVAMTAVSDGTAAINTLFNSSTNGKLSWKDASGVVNPLY